MRVFDDIFDKRYLDELTWKLQPASWYSSNIANRTTWPYGDKGTHRLLGDIFFHRKNIDIIHYNKTNIDLSFQLIDMFNIIKKCADRNLLLEQIASNLQFMGMDGSNHHDGTDEDFSYVLMLSDDFVNDDEGGEFVNETVGKTVPYKYGRIIEFKASDVHRGLAFKTPHKARYSIKFLGKVIL